MYSADIPASPVSLGHQIDVGRFLGDVVHLMCCIDTGPSLRAIWRRERSDRDNDRRLQNFISIAYSHLRAEVPRLLIAVAASARAKVDDGSWVVIEEHVGWMSQGEKLDHERGESLGVREACNKIIHAATVKPESVGERDGSQTIGALITLTGSRGGKPWCAQINLREFCIAVANTNFYPRGARPA